MSGHAQRTGAGVGPLGENATAGSTGGPAALGAGAIGGGAGSYGTGVGATGGAGGHYSESDRNLRDSDRHHGSDRLHDSSRDHKSSSANHDPNAKTGRFGTAEKDFDRGGESACPSLGI